MLFVCFIHVFSLELVHGRSLKLVGLMKEAFQAIGCKLGVFTSRQPLHESSPFLAVSSRQPLHESSPFISIKSCNFSSLSSFRILDIILSTDVQIEWFKLLWKDNSDYYNFYKEIFLRKSRFDGRKCPLTCYICLNGDLWRLNGVLPSLRL